VRFVAAASDENGIDQVTFYRVEPGGAVLLGRDGGAPYEWTTTAPSDGRSTLTVFARAIDNSGNEADSVAVAVSITP
jgi:hypothetical protein